MMSADNKVATVIRSCILCQLLCVNTLLFGLLRSQILLLYEGVTQGIENVPSEVVLSRGKNFLLSFAMTLPPLALAIWYPYVGKLGALIAAFSTMFVIYILPLATFAKAVYWQEKAALCDDDFELVKPSAEEQLAAAKTQTTKLDSFEDEELKALKAEDSLVKATTKLSSWSFRKVASWSALLAAYGIAVFVI